jgi:CHAT domain-containing protein
VRVKSIPLLAVLLALPSIASAQTQRPSIADSFRLGTGGGSLCQVQSKTRDPAIGGIFDRAWSIVCRDAARPIGKLYALRGGAATLARLADVRKTDVDCANAAQSSEALEELGSVSSQQCRLSDAPVGYRILSTARGNITWVAEGLSGYDSALKLGLRTVIADRTVPGMVSVATTSVDDPVAFAKVQAGSLDADQALAEGYRRNNSGNYAEAAEFFGTLQNRTDGANADPERVGEYLINRALQKSNLGEFAEAETLFAEARKLPTVDKVQTRLRRNFEAMHLLNQQKYAAALVRVDRAVVAIDRTIRMPNSAIEIGSQVAAEINSGLPVAQRLGATESSALTPEERAIFLDAQALGMRGTLLRLTGKPTEGLKALEQALADVIEVRDGRVVSVIRLRAQLMTESALAIEDAGDAAGAENRLREALALIETRYPQTVALNGTRARLAAMLARHGKAVEAMAEYHTVVANAGTGTSSITGLGNLLSPYFDLLTKGMAANPALADDMFVASQVLVRPGVADTQAILARELSEGSGEATRLFRQARTLERDIERLRIERAALLALPAQSSESNMALTSLANGLTTLERDQVATQAQLSAFPQYRAIAASSVSLAELKAQLKPGEAYYKMSILGGDVYALFIDAAGATGYRVPMTSNVLDAAVDALRDTIAKEEGGAVNTYPFDVRLARKLYLDLMGPVADRIASAKHLIFEPDGAMLRLPANLLIAGDAGLAAYQARIKAPDADAFDMRGIQWLGRNRALSTAVSVRAFRDARGTPASTASRQYLGFGQNAPVSNAVRVAAVRSISGEGALNCSWPTSQWNKPISAAELREARDVVGADRSTLVTEAAFSDTAVMERSDLADYRIIHFATHGLVVAPRPECPARPALLTSFGPGKSDGLLTFSEIYGLKLNADLVILSACDTAGKASIAATREAGVTTGGGSALDGLVRAFIGAGGRSVLASHWPAPDDFNATERLIVGLFKANAGTSVGDSLAQAQAQLMDDPNTSHPYYWSGFAIVGDGGQTLLAAK